MTNFKKTLLGVAAAIALAAPAANAALVNVGGVQWDTDSTNPIDDFFADTSFDQWFQSNNTGINDQDRVTVNVNNPSALIGNYLYGSGQVNGINGVNNILGQPNPETNPARFCPDCELTYAFGGIEVDNVQIFNVPQLGSFVVFTFDTTNAWVKIFVDGTPDWPGTGGRPDAVNATDGNLFLDLTFASFSLTPFANVIGGSVSAQLNVVGGLAAAYFDTDPSVVRQTTMLPGADFTYSSSSQFALNANFSSGTGEIAGDSVRVPEPASLALLGFGLFGLGGMQMRRKQKAA